MFDRGDYPSEDGPGGRFVAHKVIFGHSPCNRCEHRDADGGLACKAFPTVPGIPIPMLTAHHDHKTPFPGDHGILFKLKTGK